MTDMRHVDKRLGVVEGKIPKLNANGYVIHNFCLMNKQTHMCIYYLLCFFTLKFNLFVVHIIVKYDLYQSYMYNSYVFFPLYVLLTVDHSLTMLSHTVFWYKYHVV